MQSLIKKILAKVKFQLIIILLIRLRLSKFKLKIIIFSRKVNKIKFFLTQEIMISNNLFACNLKKLVKIFINTNEI